MVTQTEFPFGWVYTFFVQLSSLQNWCTLTKKTSCDQAPPAQLCGSSCKHPPSIALLDASYLFHMVFSLPEMCFNVRVFRGHLT